MISYNNEKSPTSAVSTSLLDAIRWYTIILNNYEAKA